MTRGIPPTSLGLSAEPALEIVPGAPLREAALRVLVPLFFVSGATSLVYETLWGRQLHLVFGTSQAAIATVLAAFMSGLALGGWLMGRVADGIRRPLRLYGLLEAGIGLYALLFPTLLSLAEPVYLSFWRWKEPSPAVFAGFQLVLVGVLLLVPTTAMGATLPLLARFVTTRLSLAGRRIGLLYGVNTAGAVVGTFLAGFILLPDLGLRATTWVAVGGNLLLGIAALLLSRRVDREIPPPVEADLETPSPPPDLALLCVAGLAGFAALVYELAWFRLLTLTLGGSAYAFSLMLLAFLAGMALGGGVGGAAADRALVRFGRPGPLVGLALVQAGVGLVSYAMMWGYGELPFLYVRLYGLAEEAESLFWPAQLFLAGALMVPPTLFMGATFSFAVRCLVARPHRLGDPVGRIYAVNTLGAILGSVTAAFVLLPNVRVVGTVLAAAGVNGLACAVAGVTAWGASVRRTRAALLAAVAGPAVAWGLMNLAPPPWDPLLMTAGMYKYVVELADRSRTHIYEYSVNPYELLFYEEGLSSVVTVARTRETGNIWLANNGKVDASTTVDMPTQVLVADYPFFFGRDLRTACVIGLASGVTAGAVTLHPGLETIDVVELEPAVFRASHFFDAYNHRPLEDPRVRAIANDGRNHLMLTPPATYDVIVSEPSNPWLTGVSNLFTHEFFLEARKRLKPGGIWSQWVQIYGMGTAEVLSLLRTFSEVFPHVMVFASIEEADLVVLGSDAPLDLDLRTVEDTLAANPALAEEMRLIDVKDPVDLLLRYQLDTEGVRSATEGVPLNTDDNMLVEFEAPRHLYEDTSTMNYLVLLAEARTASFAVESREEYLRLARAYGEHGERARALLVLRDGLGRFPGDAEMMEMGRTLRDQLLEATQPEARRRVRR